MNSHREWVNAEGVVKGAKLSSLSRHNKIIISTW